MVGDAQRQRQPRAARENLMGPRRQRRGSRLRTYSSTRAATANASTGSLTARPAWRCAVANTAGSPARRKGFVARSSAIVDGTVGASRPRRASSRADPRDQRLVVGFDGEGEAQVGERVLVRAVDPGFPGQRRELPERGRHLRGRALEQPAATAGEQRVSDECHRGAVDLADVGDVAGRVAGHVKHPQVQRRMFDFHGIAFGQCARAARDGLPGRPEHRNAASCAQRRHAARVIAVMVGDQDRLERHALAGEPALDRLIVAGIDHHRMAALANRPV